jgi:GNAT superfamily N-acetyltransferase
VQLKFRDATLEDVAVIAALQNAAAGALTARFGAGHWSGLASERGATLAQRHARVRIGRQGRVLTVLRLATKKPWAIDVSYFTPVKRPLYLTGLAISVAHQGLGLGRLALEDARAVAQAWPADAIRLDAYDAEAGAGRFYEKCGFQEHGRVVYKGDPLVYFGFGWVAGPHVRFKPRVGNRSPGLASTSPACGLRLNRARRGTPRLTRCRRLVRPRPTPPAAGPATCARRTEEGRLHELEARLVSFDQLHDFEARLASSKSGWTLLKGVGRRTRA